MAVVNGVYDGRSAWSPTYTAYPEYKYVETLYATLLTLNRIMQEDTTTTNTNVEDMFCNVMIEHGNTAPNGSPNVNNMLTTFTAFLTNAISANI